MGFPSYLEDICDRYYESEPVSAAWAVYLGPSHMGRDIDEARDLFGDPFDRPRRVINDFWAYYRRSEPLATLPAGRWETHLRHVAALHAILRDAADVVTTAPNAWDKLSGVERKLQEFFRSVPVYGTLSRRVIRQVAAESKAIRDRCNAVVRELERFDASCRTVVPAADHQAVHEPLDRLRQVWQRFDADLEGLRQYDLLTKEVQQWGNHFLQVYPLLAVQSRYRPALQQLNRLRLHEQQDGLVARDHDGAYRVQGASGSGKTIVLVHRAVRLALQHPDRVVRLFTVNRSLADLLRSTVAAIHGDLPPNLHVAAFYDFLAGVLKLFGGLGQYRLVDDRSGERAAVSWRDFYHHRGRSAAVNVFAEPAVRDLVRAVEGHSGVRVDARRYLRDEAVFIQSGYRVGKRETYLDPTVEKRHHRGVGLARPHRKACLRVLGAWEEWLAAGHLCDPDGLTSRAAEEFGRTDSLAHIRTAFPTHHVLADEVQDFSTLELGLIRRLVADPSGPNAFFFAGDVNQKAFAKHHRPVLAGFNFQGRAAVLRQNYRNTRQILRAACCLPREFPPPADEDFETADPLYSQYEGGEPIALECTPENHVRTVIGLVARRAACRVAVVSENENLLGRVRAEAARRGMRCYDLFRTEDLDRWRDQGDSLDARLVVSRLEAVKGFEFDTVVACDLSDGVLPRPGTPPEQYWREAAVTYAALTRARDELVVTYVGQPSLFLKVMSADMQFHEAAGRAVLERSLEGI